MARPEPANPAARAHGRLSGGVGELGGSSAGRHALTWVTGTHEYTTSHCAVHVKE